LSSAILLCSAESPERAERARKGIRGDFRHLSLRPLVAHADGASTLVQEMATVSQGPKSLEPVDDPNSALFWDFAVPDL